MADLRETFKQYKDCTTALYGLGVETEKALRELDGEFHIAGLLDSFREEGICYGKQIISLTQCIRLQVKLIIVVARPGSCRAIAKRIGKFCMENQIALIDVRGKNLGAQNREVYDFAGVDGVTKAQIRALIADNDVVSFDLFDTLVMRRALFDTDVIELTDRRLKEKGIGIEDFCSKRQQAEKELSKDTAPTLEEIYRFVLDKAAGADIAADGDKTEGADTRADGNKTATAGLTARELADLEWTVDCGLLVPRKEMCALLSEIVSSGKKVYIVSDTYYSRRQLEKMLDKCGVRGYTDILDSSEYKTGKRQNLFEVLKGITGEQRCLHIGDDMEADIEAAKRHGFDACQVYSGLDLLEKTGYLGMWEHTESLSSRIKIGLFTAGMFNSPFMFERQDRKLCVRESYDMGYLFMAPMIADFVVWFHHKVQEEKLDNVWFGARDGYLIKRLYDMLGGDAYSVYFLTSRMAAIRAGMEDEKDIEYVAEMKFSGTLQQQLKERFGLSVEEKDGTEKLPAGTVTEEKSLMDYSRVIWEKSREYKRNYRRYLQTLPLAEGDIAFFDFVAKGTSQMYIGRLVENHLKGLYFLQLEKDNMQDKNLDITAFYESREAAGSAIYENYYILETVLTSKEPSITGFDEDGKAVFARETRTERDIGCIKRMQDGITDYFRSYIQICPASEITVDKRLDEVFLELIHKFKILDKDFINLKVEDPFFNRMTDMTDLI